MQPKSQPGTAGSTSGTGSAVVAASSSSGSGSGHMLQDLNECRAMGGGNLSLPSPRFPVCLSLPSGSGSNIK